MQTSQRRFREGVTFVLFFSLTMLAGVRSLPAAGAVESAEASAAQAQDKAAPKCAFIDAPKSALTALVEAKLLQDTQRAWLERTEIEKIVAEQQLQAAFGAAAGPDRVRLGRLLKADVLVLLRTGQKRLDGRRQQAWAEVVAAETAGGLRLLARTLVLSGDTEADASSLARTIGQGLAKYGQQIRDVYAVLPFVCQNLTYEYDYLRDAYAKLLEELLLRQPGTVTAELAEAEALAKEYQLAAPSEKPQRRLPLYFLGQYRHERRGNDIQVTITLTVKRGAKQVGEAARTVAPADAPAAIRQLAMEVLPGGHAHPFRIDPAARAIAR